MEPLAYQCGFCIVSDQSRERISWSVISCLMIVIQISRGRMPQAAVGAVVGDCFVTSMS